MHPKWHFNEFRPGDRTRESQVEKFFSADAVANRANAIVREGIQNSLDASSQTAPLRVRIAISKWSTEEQRARLPSYVNGLMNHLSSWKKKNVQAPTVGTPMRFLVFEDFGTTGLSGNPRQWRLEESAAPNPFFNYFRAEGVSDKEGNNRGRHGVGKFVFAAASSGRAIFGLTRRTDGRELLMGTCVLNNHFLNNITYQPDGFYGSSDAEAENLVLPVENHSEVLEKFKSEFSLARKNETGLSVVVPWLDPEVDASAIVTAVLEGYFYPIITQHLTVEVENESGEITVISAETIEEIASTQPDGRAGNVSALLKLAKAAVNATSWIPLTPPDERKAPKWSAERMTEAAREQIQSELDRGNPVTIHVPMYVRTKSPDDSLACSFIISMQRDADLPDGQITFVREGIIVSDVRPRRTSGIRAMVVIDEGPLATFLGDSENPSHTQWQHDLVKDSYTYAPAHLWYVVQAVPQIITLLSDAKRKPDASLLIDLFSLPDPTDEGLNSKQKKAAKKAGAETDQPADIPPPKLKAYRIHKTQDGFTIQSGDTGAARPTEITFRAAYGVRRGSPFAKFDPADFRFGKEVTIKTFGAAVTTLGENRATVKIIDDHFRVELTGFDVNRDLHIDAKVLGQEEDDAEET